MNATTANTWNRYYRPILQLGVPIAIGQLGVIIMGFADTMMVGRFSTDALAAASFVNAVFNLFVYMMLGYSYGLTPLISSLVGQGRRAEAGGTLKYGLICNLVFALLLMLILGVGYCFIDRMGQPAEILPLVRPYYLTIGASLLFVALFNALRQFTDGISETSTGMWVILVGNVLNIVGNFVLIYGVGPFPRLGLLGAGVSTLTSRIVMAVIMVALLLGRKRYAAYRQGFCQSAVRTASLLHINRQSFPISLQMGMESGAFTVSGIMAGWLGAVDLATYQVMITLGGLGFLLYYSFGSGITIRVAHFYGQNDWSSVRSTTRAGVFILLGMAAISSMIFYFGGEFIIHGFTSDPAVISLSLTLILPMILYQLGDSRLHANMLCQRPARHFARDGHDVGSLCQLRGSQHSGRLPAGLPMRFRCGGPLSGVQHRSYFGREPFCVELLQGDAPRGMMGRRVDKLMGKFVKLLPFWLRHCKQYITYLLVNPSTR